MPFLKRHRNALISLVFMVFTIALSYQVIAGNRNFGRSYPILSSILILNILWIFFAFMSKKLKESSSAGTVLIIIGALTLVVVLFNYLLAFMFAVGCGNGPC